MTESKQPIAKAGLLGVDGAALFAKAEWLCRTVAARDLGSTPLYILPSSALSDQAGGAADCNGFTTPSLDLYLRDYIPSYRGRGPCMVIDHPLEADLLPEDIEYFTLATALHELAHILDRPSLYVDRAGIDPAKLKFESLVVGKATQKPPPANLPRYFGHGIEFIRICLHLRYRAGLAGVHIASNNLCAGWQYGLSHANLYDLALGDEPAQMIDATLCEILAAPTPRPFRERWLKDTAD